MSGQSPELGKGLFGYRRSAVDQILADRDGMLRRAEGRVRSGELKMAELGRDLAAAAERSVEVDRRWGELEAEMDRLAAWSERAESMMGSFRSALEEFRLRLEEVPDQVRQALSDLADGISSIDPFLRNQASTLTPPVSPQFEDAKPK